MDAILPRFSFDISPASSPLIYVLTAENIPRNQALFDDFLKFRHRIFIDKLRYAPPSPDGRERDGYDTPEAIYLIGVVAGRRVISSLRLNPTERPYMLREVWPELIVGPPPVSACESASNNDPSEARCNTLIWDGFS